MTVRFEVEPFGAVLPEIEGLMQAHWREVSEPGSPPLSLDHSTYAALDAAGAVLLVTARGAAGDLLGYIVHLLHRPLHYRDTLIAADDAHFLLPIARRGRTFLRMLAFAEARLKERGVQIVRYHTKARPDLDKSRVFQAAGYRCAEHIMAKGI
ncbi:hypothetical protein QMO56_25015 [Roseomonas sp. E05]|uniref:hypothetical protein n=1 Tax=Roseomonas sp. E05 TaxID=3046310 RepID=UPI0024BA8D2B|nr:hypothetical protein [Roseomonas sp. E05]MDJ0391373.1 hypothetical protein [Roseomonas sp. E05]